MAVASMVPISRIFVRNINPMGRRQNSLNWMHLTRLMLGPLVKASASSSWR